MKRLWRVTGQWRKKRLWRVTGQWRKTSTIRRPLLLCVSSSVGGGAERRKKFWTYALAYTVRCAVKHEHTSQNPNSEVYILITVSGPLVCPETSARNYHYRLRNIPEARRSNLFRGVRLKSCIGMEGIAKAGKTSAIARVWRTPNSMWDMTSLFKKNQATAVNGWGRGGGGQSGGCILYINPLNAELNPICHLLVL
jgi:hypothetical protein